MENCLKKFLQQSLSLWVIVMAFLICLTMPANAQKPIKPKPKGTTTKTTTTTRRTTSSKPKTTTTRPTATTRTTPRTTTTTTTDDDEDDDWDDSHLAGGFEIFGRPLDNYTDNAKTQKGVREAIQEHGDVKTGCLTNEAAAIVWGGNGYNTNGLCQDMLDALKSINNNKQTITDVAYTDVGWWCVIYEDKYYKGNLPNGCKAQLDDMIGNGQKILSISISESGDFAIISDAKYYASNEIDSKCIKSAIDIYGHVNSICITNRGTLVTCSGGIFYVNVPRGVIEKLKKQDFTPTVIRFTDSGTYIAFDGKGGKAWYM